LSKSGISQAVVDEYLIERSAMKAKKAMKAMKAAAMKKAGAKLSKSGSSQAVADEEVVPLSFIPITTWRLMHPFQELPNTSKQYCYQSGTEVEGVWERHRPIKLKEWHPTRS